MRVLLGVMCLLNPTAGFAHIGHLGELAGHDHVVAGVAIGIAIAIGVAGALKGQGAEEGSTEAEEDTEAEPETSEA